MKQYKIVKHHISPDEYMFRIYKRVHVFFWEWESSWDSKERCENYVSQLIEHDKAQKVKKAKTPKPETIAYL